MNDRQRSIPPGRWVALCGVVALAAACSGVLAGGTGGERPAPDGGAGRGADGGAAAQPASGSEERPTGDAALGPDSASARGDVAAAGSSTAVTLQQLKDDNDLEHDRAPLPVIPDGWSYSRSGCPHNSACGEPTGPRSYADDGRNYFNPWGYVLPDPSTPAGLNAGFELGAIVLYVKRKSTGQWSAYDHGACSAGYIFLGASGIPGAPGTSYDPIGGPGGGQLFKLGMGGFAQNQGLHFWPEHAHEQIPNPDVEHVAVSITARVALQDPNGPDDREQARYLIGLGVDHRILNEGAAIIQGCMVGRHRYLTSEWQTFTGSTLRADEVDQAPPPIVGRTW